MAPAPVRLSNRNNPRNWIEATKINQHGTPIAQSRIVTQLEHGEWGRMIHPILPRQATQRRAVTGTSTS
jgi:hypothetical protein